MWRRDVEQAVYTRTGLTNGVNYLFGEVVAYTSRHGRPGKSGVRVSSRPAGAVSHCDM